MWWEHRRAKEVEVEIPELGAHATASTGEDGQAAIHFEVKGLERWSPETPKLYKVTVRAGHGRDG